MHKVKVITGKYNGNPTITFFRGEDGEEPTKFNSDTFGLEKAKRILAHVTELKDFVLRTVPPTAEELNKARQESKAKRKLDEEISMRNRIMAELELEAKAKADRERIEKELSSKGYQVDSDTKILVS